MPNTTTTNDTNDGRPCPHCREREGVAPGRRFCDPCLDAAERDDGAACLDRSAVAHHHPVEELGFE